MHKFSITEALKGKPLTTRYGHIVTELHFDDEIEDYPLIAKLTPMFGFSHIERFDLQGKTSHNQLYNLMMVDDNGKT